MWSIAEQRWTIFLTEAEGIRRSTMHTPTRRAAGEAQLIGRATQANDVVDTVLAMYLMQSAQPWRFKSEKAFRTEMVRRVRSLSPTTSGTWNHPSGSAKKALRELPPRVVEVFGAWLVQLLGQAGVYLSQRRTSEQAKAEEDRKAFAKSLVEMDLV